MSDLVINGPSEDGEANNAAGINDDGPRSNASGGGPQKGRRILDEKGCLEALTQLPGMVALGYLKPAQANAIRATYSDLLQHHQRAKAREEDRQTLPDATLRELARKDPQLLNMLGAILTDEQIEMIMKDTKDGGNEPA